MRDRHPSSKFKPAINFKKTRRKYWVSPILLLSGVFLFALSFPSFLFQWGIAPLAWLSLIPVTILIRRQSLWTTPLWGAAYGYLTYALFNFWLANFNPVSFLVVPVVYAAWFFLLFPALKIADSAFPRMGWIIQLIMWGAYEVARTKGFLGYGYGILGYSQYSWLSFIGIADIFGVMGPSLLVAYPSFLIGSSINSRIHTSCSRIFSKRIIVAGSVWLFLMAASIIYGRFSMVDYSDSPRWRPALVQQNVNTWLTGSDAWNEALDVLIDQSQNALELEPDAIIWPETAFVPAIEWHLKYRQDRNRVEMIKKLYEFLEDQSIPFIIGNNDAILDGGERKESNAVLLFDENRIVSKYRKIHLVPFTESFPYGKQFPRLLSYIQDQGTPLYQKGEEFTLFNLGSWGGPVIGPIICFEDTFGYLSREFVSKGAEVLVNLTNDSWSNEPVAAIQHATISVFRAVENRRSLVRATTSGLTTAIDPNGRMLEKLPTFIAGTLIADVPIYTERETIYTRHGDWLEKVILGLAAAVAILSVVTLVLLSHRKRNQV